MAAIGTFWEGMMKLPRRKFLRLAAGAAALPAVSRVTSAQQSNQAAPSQKGTRVITLGTKNGPYPVPGRAQSSNLLTVNNAQYVIDAGDGITRRLARLRNNFRAIDNIFITHPHSDHISGLGALMMVIYDSNRRNPVNIYGPPGTAASVKGLLEFLTVHSEIRISDGPHSVQANQLFKGHDASVGVIFQDANVKVTAVENSHFHFPSGTPGYGKYKSYSYRFDTADRSVVFTGDTGPSDAVADLAKGADLLVSEVTNSVEDFKAEQIKAGR
jgi:ribonuclease BN (tRNA processing enzyme)